MSVQSHTDFFLPWNTKSDSKMNKDWGCQASKVTQNSHKINISQSEFDCLRQGSRQKNSLLLQGEKTGAKYFFLRAKQQGT